MKFKNSIINICLIITYIFIINTSCSYKLYIDDDVKPLSKIKSGNYDNEFYYAFTSATKNAIFGQYKEAIRDYNECLEYKRKSSAIHYMLSSIYLNAGDIETAKSYADSAVFYDTTNNKWYLLHLANIYNFQNEIDSSIKIYEKLVDLNEKDMDLKYKLALMYEQVNEYDKALSVLEKIENVIGVNENVLISRHKIYSNTGREKEAIEQLKLAIKYYPDNYNLLGLLAEYYADIGENEMADKYYNILLNTDPDNNKTQLSYAEFLRENNKLEKAFNFYRDAINNDNIELDIKISLLVRFIKKDTVFDYFNNYIKKLIAELKNRHREDIRVRTISADFYIKNNELELAENELNEVIDIDRNNYLIWEQLLYIENALGKYDDIIRNSTEAIKIFKEEPTLYLFGGIALIQKGENKEATVLLEDGIEYVENKSQKAQFHNFLGEAYRSLNDFKKSDQNFEKALEIEPENLLIRNNYSYYLAIREENLKKAEELSRLTIETEPKNFTYLDTYGWILYKKGDKNKARRYIEKAIKHGGDKNSEILDHYGDILYDLSDSKEAIFYWNEAIKYSNNNDDILEKIKKAESKEKK
jgi:tetratricopeptide (TPR) repeat protein